MKILITGGAGFIGFHLAKFLLSSGKFDVVLLDNLNDYYDTQLKTDRLEELKMISPDGYHFVKLDLTDRSAIDSLFQSEKFDVIVNLAAQAGVRYARENPDVYIKSNVDGFFNVIDAARQNECGLVLYASSSSVYGGNKKIPFEESDQCANPLSIYAASKLANEMTAEAYKSTFGMKCIGLRFFNVYGPWGRPDAVYYKWSDALTQHTPIDLRDNGEMYRDMTYVGDVVKSIGKLIEYGGSVDGGFHEVFNIGNENPVRTGDLLEYLIKKFDTKPAVLESTPRGIEEPISTRASTEKLRSTIGYAPGTHFTDGIDSFFDWYITYHKFA